MSEPDPLARLVSALTDASNALDDLYDSCDQITLTMEMEHQRAGEHIDNAARQALAWQTAVNREDVGE